MPASDGEPDTSADVGAGDAEGSDASKVDTGPEDDAGADALFDLPRFDTEPDPDVPPDGEDTEDTATDPCVDEPCAFGECVPADGGFVCDCDAGYEGDLCESNIDDCADVVCQNEGICADLVNGYLCECADGFEGEVCETNIDDCAGIECLNGSACLDLVEDYRCDCLEGFGGRHCEIDADDCADEPCLHDGVCLDRVAGYECECAPGYEGGNCEFDIDECIGNACENGACIDEVNGYSCDCDRGWEGALCEINPDDCADGPCANGGLCFDGLDEFVCRCARGWDGPTCEIELDSCDFLPCENDAPCTNLAGVDRFSCECPAGYFGQTCGDACEQGRCVGAVTCNPTSGGDRECLEGCVDGFAGRDCGIDLRTCAEDPCYPTVACNEVPGEGITCGPCPTDFEGDGERCIPAVTMFHTYGDPNDDLPTGSGQNFDLTVDEDDNIYVLGTFGGDFQIGTLTIDVHRFGAYVAKFTDELELLWATQFSIDDGTTGENSPLEIQIHPISGDVILAGNADFTGEVYVGGEYWGLPNPSSSATAISLDHETGEPNWVTIIDPSVTTRGEGVAITPSGDVVIAFGAASPLSGLPALRGSASYVAFLDQDTGEVTDGFGYGDTEPHWTHPFAVDAMPNGDVVVGGQYHSGPMGIGDFTLPWGSNQNGFVARFSREGTARWAAAVATDNMEQVFAIEHGPSGAVYFSGWHEGGTSIDGLELESASRATMLVRLNGDTGVAEWITGHAPSSSISFGLRRFLVDEDELIHFASSTTATASTRFGTNDATVPPSGVEIRMSLVDGATGASLRERVIGIGGPIIHSNTFALLGTDQAVVAGSYSSPGTLFGEPFGGTGRSGYDHYLMRVARLIPPESD